MSFYCMPSDMRLCMLVIVGVFDCAPGYNETKYSFGLGISLPEYCV